MECKECGHRTTEDEHVEYSKDRTQWQCPKCFIVFDIKEQPSPSHSELNDGLSSALRALCFTRDYVGEKTLPAIEGWDWYDAGMKICKLIPDDEWAEQFRLRIKVGITEILNEGGFKTVEGKDAVLNMIKSASDGNMKLLCSGYKVFPGGRKCKGCEDCEIR